MELYRLTATLFYLVRDSNKLNNISYKYHLVIYIHGSGEFTIASSMKVL